MNKTKIEWCDYTINPVKGLCPMACPYCYARRMYKRFKWSEKVVWYPQAYDVLDKHKLLDGEGLKDPSRIFIGSTFELFHDSLPDIWMEYNLGTAKKYPQHTFIFLTKQPQNLIKWSPFPDNCWVGVSATDAEEAYERTDYLASIKATIKFVSFEPLLGQPDGNYNQLADVMKQIHWLIIGQQTPVKLETMPKIGWIEGIVNAADEANIPVFLKDNLYLIFAHPTITNGFQVPKWAHANHGINILRQEFPK